jgi:hypothetical protein
MTQTYDLSIIHRKEVLDITYGQRMLSNFTALSAGTGTQTSGIKKIAQRFTQLLLTVRGSSIAYPNNGSNFIDSAKDINVNMPEIMLTVRESIDTAVQQIQDMETEDDPSSERLIGAELGTPVIYEDKIGLAVLLIVQSNETARLYLDINALIAL